MSTSFPANVKPFVQWKHVDGPVIFFPGSSPKWLSLYERLLFKIGFLKITDFDNFGNKKK